MASRPLPAAPLLRARREHIQLLARLSRALVTWDAGWGLHDRPHASSAAALRLTRCADAIAAHLAEEERSVYPLLRTRLPIETGTFDAALDEHATLRDLLAALQQRCRDIDAGRADVGPAVATLLRDLLDLWRLHARRIDRAVAPLLRRLERKDRPHV